MAGLTIQQILQRGSAAFERSHPLPAYVRRAAWALLVCRTAVLGGHVQRCPEGHCERIWYNSCRHRLCPQCAWLAVERWLVQQRSRLLTGEHYHVIFTLPDGLRGLWVGNVKPMSALLFAAVRHTVFELLEDSKYLGGRPGMIAALHTWRQTLVLHPHLHCLVTGGGLSAAGQWRGVRNGFLLPVRVVMAVFRGKLLAALDTAVQAGRLTLPEGMTMAQWATLRNKLGRTKWNVHIRERYPHGGGVLTYLARYLRGGPLANTRLVSLGPEGVTFRDRVNGEGAASPRRGLMTLSLEEFLRRYLRHVPVPGSRVVRAYGLYAPTKGDDLAVCRAQLGPVSVATPVELAGSADGSVPSALEPERCPMCGRRLLRCGVILPTGRPPPDVRPREAVA